MSGNPQGVQNHQRLGPGDIAAIVLFGINVLAWMLGGGPVMQALSVAHQPPPPSDAVIGALVVAIACVVVGVPMFLLSGALALASRRLSTAFRIISVLPGLLAIAAGVWMLILMYD
jgi:threonine/homoserine/homoserine lactone efflux protein